MKLIKGDFKQPAMQPSLSEDVLRARYQFYGDMVAWGFAYLIFITGAVFVGLLFYLA